MDHIQPRAALVLAALPLAAALLCAVLIGWLRPWLMRYALARPNARSAHVVPTPQGGGLAVMAATISVAAGGCAVLALDSEAWLRYGLVASAVVVVGLTGLVDDIRPLPPLPRLGLQALAMVLAVAALPPEPRALPMLPPALERVVLVVGGTWFVNLTNFMDGMDWMTVAEFVPATAALALFWQWGFLSPVAGLLALALLGGLVGFAPFNRPVARLFLGDVGSLPIGLLAAFCLVDLAAHGGLAAAILLPLYPVADTGLTLLWRLRRGEKVWQPHRLHFYQVAVARGFTVREVLGRVFAVNVALALVAAMTLLRPDAVPVTVDMALGVFVVTRLLRGLAAGRPAAAP